MALKRNRTKYDDSATLFKKMSHFLIPSVILASFDLVDLQERDDRWIAVLHEKRHLYPEELSSIADLDSIVLDGFLRPDHLLCPCFNLKPVYFKLVRRRWRQSGSTKHYFNHYNFNLDGIKFTHEMGAFFKS